MDFIKTNNLIENSNDWMLKFKNYSENRNQDISSYQKLKSLERYLKQEIVKMYNFDSLKDFFIYKAQEDFNQLSNEIIK